MLGANRRDLKPIKCICGYCIKSADLYIVEFDEELEEVGIIDKNLSIGAKHSRLKGLLNSISIAGSVSSGTLRTLLAMDTYFEPYNREYKYDYSPQIRVSCDRTLIIIAPTSIIMQSAHNFLLASCNR